MIPGKQLLVYCNFSQFSPVVPALVEISWIHQTQQGFLSALHVFLKSSRGLLVLLWSNLSHFSSIFPTEHNTYLHPTNIHHFHYTHSNTPHISSSSSIIQSTWGNSLLLGCSLTKKEQSHYRLSEHFNIMFNSRETCFIYFSFYLYLFYSVSLTISLSFSLYPSHLLKNWWGLTVTERNQSSTPPLW